LGTCLDGGTLHYDDEWYAFTLKGATLALAQVKALDCAAKIHWEFLEQRDWLWRIDALAFKRAHERAMETLEDANSARDLNAWITRHVKRDNSYLHGRIVEEKEEAAAPSAVVNETGVSSPEAKADKD
jgi:hypothetical protein